tara:strand:+ start:174 stop:425 length:252 start_codon:yes stop_codon:yes gene_type:complete
MDTKTKSEEQFIADIKKSIEETTLRVSDKVIKSAYSYLVKNACLDPAKEAVAKSFFVKKIPAVISAEMTKELNTVLGLNLELD